MRGSCLSRLSSLTTTPPAVLVMALPCGSLTVAVHCMGAVLLKTLKYALCHKAMRNPGSFLTQKIFSRPPPATYSKQPLAMSACVPQQYNKCFVVSSPRRTRFLSSAVMRTFHIRKSNVFCISYVTTHYFSVLLSLKITIFSGKQPRSSSS